MDFTKGISTTPLMLALPRVEKELNSLEYILKLKTAFFTRLEVIENLLSLSDLKEVSDNPDQSEIDKSSVKSTLVYESLMIKQILHWCNLQDS